MEFGSKNGRALMFLPGTACRRQFNFKNVVDELAEKYHIIAVNCDGFEGRAPDIHEFGVCRCMEG